MKEPVHLQCEVEKFLRRSGMAPTRFGRLAMSDPRFVGGLRSGREPRDATVKRVMAFIKAQDPQTSQTPRS